MLNAFIEKATALNAANQVYAIALVVRRRIPSSGKPGDKAIITSDGQVHGWIGGGCTKGIVIKEALLALQEEKPRLISISPDEHPDFFRDVKTYNMNCQSEGAVDVYIEPVLPKPSLLIFGNSHIAMALAKIARTMDYYVTAVMHQPDDSNFPTVNRLENMHNFGISHLHKNSYAVVCTQGEGDNKALEKAISLKTPYLSFVSSRKKASKIFHELLEKGIPHSSFKHLQTPAGLDIGAKLPEEVAISILAQIIQTFRNAEKPTKDISISNEAYYMNPVCNLPIHKSSAKYVIEHNEKSVYFCCDGCKNKFELEPETYLTTVS